MSAPVRQPRAEPKARLFRFGSRFGILALTVLGFVTVNTFHNDWWEYVIGRDFITGIFRLLGLVLAAYTMVNLLGRRGSKWLRAGLPAALIAFLLFVSVSRIDRRDRASHRLFDRDFFGQTDVEILSVLTEHSMYYPSERVLAEARREIPPNEAVLYFGDYRPDPVNYGLYPRPVYALPITQRLGLAALQEAWSRRIDPMFPDGFAARADRIHFDPEDIPSELGELIRQHDIRWVIHMSMRNPERSGFWRIQSP
jgi:hypothetical protein